MLLLEVVVRLLNALATALASIVHSSQSGTACASAVCLICRLGPALRSEAPERAMGAAVLLLELAERLLNAFAAAAASAEPASVPAVEKEYEAARDEVLQALLDQALRFRDQGVQGL